MRRNSYSSLQRVPAWSPWLWLALIGAFSLLFLLAWLIDALIAGARIHGWMYWAGVLVCALSAGLAIVLVSRLMDHVLPFLEALVVTSGAAAAVLLAELVETILGDLGGLLPPLVYLIANFILYTLVARDLLTRWAALAPRPALTLAVVASAAHLAARALFVALGT